MLSPRRRPLSRAPPPWPLLLGLALGRSLVKPMGARLHDQSVGVIKFDPGAASVGRGEHLDQLVTGQPGKIVERLDPIFTQRDEHPRGQSFERRKIILDPELAEAVFIFAIAPLQSVAGAILQLGGNLSVETLDFSEV